MILCIIIVLCDVCVTLGMHVTWYMCGHTTTFGSPLCSSGDWTQAVSPAQQLGHFAGHLCHFSLVKHLLSLFFLCLALMFTIQLVQKYMIEVTLAGSLPCNTSLLLNTGLRVGEMAQGSNKSTCSITGPEVGSHYPCLVAYNHLQLCSRGSGSLYWPPRAPHTQRHK